MATARRLAGEDLGRLEGGGAAGPDLASYDLILVNTSGGKDSSAAALVVARMAEAAGAKGRVVLVHATFPEEWPLTVEVVRAQAAQLGLPVEVVERGEGLLDYVLRRRMWPDAKRRYCTSEFKRAPVDKLLTRLAPGLDRPARVLNVMGIRAQESPARAKRLPFRRDDRRSNGRRAVDEWLPIFDWTLDRVWAAIKEAGAPTHPAYALGMPRLSCMFCIFAPKAALVLAGRHNPAALERYVEVEREIGHAFKDDGRGNRLTMAEVREAVRAGQAAEAADWKM